MSGRAQVEPVLAAPFDAAVPDGGYRWWYLDALSEDGRHGVVVIAFVGSVFSPYYFRARRRGEGRAEHFCAINVALYGPGAGRWAMTERPARAVARSERRLGIGPSALEWCEGSLVVDVRERAAPFGQRMIGRIRLTPDIVNQREFALDGAARHRWQPLAPRAGVEVSFEKPGLHWQGGGYLDTNHGVEPLEQGFTSWNWSRSTTDGRTQLTYDVIDRAGRERPLAIEFDAGGALRPLPPGPQRPLERSAWGVARATRCEHDAEVVETLEDTPFYARSTLRLNGHREARIAVHESLSLTRFCAPWVRLLLPFRMPRNPWTPPPRD